MSWPRRPRLRRRPAWTGRLAKPFTLRQLAELLQAHAPALRDETPGAVAATGSDALRDSAPVRDDLLDAEVLDGLLGLGDGAFLDRILGLYRAQAPQALSALRAALTASDQPAIAKAAHSLKSMSANIGARALVEPLRAIELAARDSACAEAPSACDALERLLDATVAGLDRQTRGHRAAA
jgi:HPt (histidine-containing phosphotransfer) domain-containing protein